MKKTLFVFAAILLVTALPAAAQYGADEGLSFTIGGYVGASIPSSPDEFSDNFDAGVAFGGFATGHLTGPLDWRIEGGWATHGCGNDALCSGGIDADFDITHFAGGVQFSSSGRAKGYGFFLVGAYNGETKISGGGIDSSDGDTEFGISFGGGASFYVGQSWGLGGDVHINAAFAEDDTVWWIIPNGFVFVGF